VSSHEVAPPSRNQERVVAEFRARGGKVGDDNVSMRLGKAVAVVSASSDHHHCQ
jgi:hypothetical protein